MKLTPRAFTAGLLFATVAAAQDDATVTAAREIANQGLEAYDAGRYEEAADKLRRAYQVVKLPTLALHTARALVQVGRLVEASEVYLQATRLEASGGFQHEQEQAQLDAARERSELMPRIPTLLVRVEGAEGAEVAVTIDGKRAPMALLGAGYVVDPGTRRIEGTLGDQSAIEEVSVSEGERKSVVLRFEGLEPAATFQPSTPTSPAAAEAAPPPETPSPPPRSAPPSEAAPNAEQDVDTLADDSQQRTLGWVGLGVGGAGLLFGTITGLMVASKKSKLDDGGCVHNECYVDQSDDVESYNSMRTISTVGFIVGVVGSAAGATLLLTASHPQTPGPEVHAWLGAGAAGFAGRF